MKTIEVKEDGMVVYQGLVDTIKAGFIVIENGEDMDKVCKHELITHSHDAIEDYYDDCDRIVAMILSKSGFLLPIVKSADYMDEYVRVERAIKEYFS